VGGFIFVFVKFWLLFVFVHFVAENLDGVPACSVVCVCAIRV
jgi:hypothetical protein